MATPRVRASRVKSHRAERTRYAGIHVPPATRPASTPDSRPPEVSKKPARERLRDVSADVRTLKIRSGKSIARGADDLPPMVESPEGKLAILGLDFGTAFTKAMVQWKRRHHPVDWSLAVESDDPYLMASAFSESPDGRCVLGAFPGWTMREGIKLRLLSGQDMAQSDFMDAVIFVALSLRFAHQWLMGTSEEAREGVRWNLHLGLPARAWDDGVAARNFKVVARAARKLAARSGPISRSAVVAVLREREGSNSPAVSVFPEFACQLYSYLESPERADDLHMLVDIGAGTLDIASFNVFPKDDELLLPIFSSEVHLLGAHYLIAALAGREGRGVWEDSDSSLDDQSVAIRTEETVTAVAERRSLYLSSVTSAYGSVAADAKRAYPTSPAFRGGSCIRLFLCGGGSRIPALRDHFHQIAIAYERHGVRYGVSDLVTPRGIVGQIGDRFDRLSVAYGLSQLAPNIGNVMRSATLEPLFVAERPMEKHRDDDR